MVARADLGQVEFRFRLSSRNFFKDELALFLTNCWSPYNFGETCKDDVQFDYRLTFDKVWYFTPSISGGGGQWGEQSEGGLDYTYWNVGPDPRLQ
jgi:hypothetical protein